MRQARFALLALLLPGVCAPVRAAERPWWDDFPTLVQTHDVAKARAAHATGVLCGAADDCAWGIWGQRLRVAESGPRTTGAMHAAGLKALSWFEGFGTPSLYVVQLKRNPDGSWVKWPDDDLTRVFRNAWGWRDFDGTGEVRWTGLHTYFDDLDYARPYTRTHRRYGCPPLTYPDGRPAVGYDGPETDPRNSRVYDACCAKNVLGEAWAASRGKALITEALRGGAAAVAGEAGMSAPTVVPDPGFTPAEWAERTRSTGALLHLGTGKDAACPIWTDYARAEVRLALDTGVDGLWIDNFSPWDSFNAHPLHHAFGEWSVARFRGYLEQHFTRTALDAMGVGDPAGFDVREYLQARVRQWGGNPRDLRDHLWGDPRWQDDAVWRAYLIHTRQCGSEALSQLYRVLKGEAAAAGKPDFPILGNDIPAFSLGWPRGDLDMVSTELTWGWWLASGPRGIMPPPLGCYVPVYKLAREHARSRFVSTWPYAAKDVEGKPGISDLISYQGLATHTLPLPQLYGSHTMGTEASNAAFLAFVRSVAPVFGERRPVEEVGLYYSSSSQLVDMLPAGYRDHGNQVHSFSFWGWGTALTWLHTPWLAVPEWKLAPEVLDTLRVLILPSCEVFPAESVPSLERWVRSGGRLIVAGACGMRLGEEGNFERCAAGSTLADLASTAGERKVGKGRVLLLAPDPGLPFYQADGTRPELLAGFRRCLEPGAEALALSAPGATWQVGLTPYRDGDRLFVDVNNTAIDLASDEVTAAAPLDFSVRLPGGLRGRRLTVQVLSPQQPPPAATIVAAGPDRVRVHLGSVTLYASVLVKPADAPHR